MHLLSQQYGEVEKEFAEKFKNELGPMWTFIDYHGNRFMVTYNRDANKPLLTDGWSSLWLFYGLTGDHAVWLRYVGDSTFQVTVFKKPSTPISFPRFHSKYRKQLHVEQ